MGGLFSEIRESRTFPRTIGIEQFKNTARLAKKKGRRTLLFPYHTAPFCGTSLAGGLVSIPGNYIYFFRVLDTLDKEQFAFSLYFDCSI